jgi:arsenate reductase (glutaredoxin)
MKIYHNPRCGKSRNALSILLEYNSDIQVIEYLKSSPTESELRDLLKKLAMKPEDIVRKGEAIYKEKYKGKQMSDDEWIAALLENPLLMERPIIVKGDKAIIARPPERVKELL